jgi:hypothetical protein
MSYHQRKIKEIFEGINAGIVRPKEVFRLHEHLSHQSCRSKLKLNFEEAGARYGRYPEETTFYLCPSCSYLHAGHEVRWVDTAVNIIVKKKQAKDRQKSKKPKWMSDPRRSND